jgi:ABC-type dipeptide/oligopeptide/nickel transport system permease component
MLRFFLRRLALIPFALVLVNFVGFVFAHVTYQLQQSQTIYGSGQDELVPFWPAYTEYASNAILHLNFGNMPVGINQPITEALGKASAASLGLLAISFVLSVGLGLALGLAAVRVSSTQPAPWMPLITTIGLAMPSFYIGTLLVSLILMPVIGQDAEPLLPISGFGWDLHLLLPVLALTIRPTMQVAQVTGSLLAGELSKRYVVAARSFGHTWRAIRWDKALRNVMAPIFLTIAGSFRLLVAELLLVEWLFNWPGLGRLLVQTLVPPRISSLGGMMDVTIFFLNPPLVAGLLVVFAFLFLLADTLASGLARMVDPRMRIVEEEAFDG